MRTPNHLLQLENKEYIERVQERPQTQHETPMRSDESTSSTKTLIALFNNVTDYNLARSIDLSKAIEHLQNEKKPIRSKSTSSNSESRIIIDHKIYIFIIAVIE